MKLEAFEAEARLEQLHWWFVVRRQLFRRYINAFHIAKDTKVLDIGTSTGTNLRLLTEMGFKDIKGLDFSDHAIAFCKEKGLPPVEKGNICEMPFAKNSFDLVLATDIVEHVIDDRKAISEIYRVLKPGGHALVTVPMFQALWGLQDDISMHQRRYQRDQFRRLIASQPFKIQKAFFFNFLLFLPILFTRKILSVLNIKAESENDINNPTINTVLKLIFRIDIALAPVLHMPFGVSYFCVVRKLNDNYDA